MMQIYLCLIALWCFVFAKRCGKNDKNWQMIALSIGWFLVGLILGSSP